MQSSDNTAAPRHWAINGRFLTQRMTGVQRYANEIVMALDGLLSEIDDAKVPVPRDLRDAAAVTEIVMRVGDGILAQQFEPTPSQAACSICDYRIVCPVAER